MDNIKFHHSMDTRNALTTKGFHQIFVPPYSPTGNAIEDDTKSHMDEANTRFSLPYVRTAVSASLVP